MVRRPNLTPSLWRSNVFGEITRSILAEPTIFVLAQAIYSLL